jgi:hypothetical protein
LPTGTVQFALDGAPEGSPVPLNGQASATSAPINGLTPGNFQITATYSGDVNFLGSAGSVGQAVGPAATTTSLTTNPNPSAFKAPVTLTASVAVSGNGVGTPTGTVDFYDGAVLIGAGTLSHGSTSTTSSGLSVGQHSLTAVYLGEADFTGSTSSAVLQTVSADPTTTALTVGPNPSQFGAPVTLTASVTPTLSNPNTPGGSVTFKDGSTTLGTGSLAANGTATLTVSTLAVGSHSITAAYSGDGVFGASTSAAVTQSVTKAVTGITAQNPSGSTLTAILQTAQGPLAGQVLQFSTHGTALCAVQTGANGSASCNDGSNGVSVLLFGYDVTYAGNGSYLPSSAHG